MDTEKLIQTLADTAKPVRPLRRPWVRSAIWLAIAVPYMALVVYVMSPRADLMAKLADGRYLFEQFATLATGVTAALAAFASTIPGYNRKILLVPALPLAAWLGDLGLGCIEASLSNGLSLQSDWFCLPAIILVGAIPAVAMVMMLRRGAPLTPCTTVTFGALAAAGLGDFGLRLFHPQDASLMVLVWQVGSVFILTALASCAGRRILNWRSLIGIAVRPRTAE
jgi:hypothetical protein